MRGRSASLSRNLEIIQHVCARLDEDLNIENDEQGAGPCVTWNDALPKRPWPSVFTAQSIPSHHEPGRIHVVAVHRMA